MMMDTNNFVKNGKLNNEEKGFLRECVIEGVEFISRIMNGKKKLYKFDDIYVIDLSNLRLYVNEFAELVKNNKEPMVNKLFDECVYNIERLYLLQQDINNEKEKAKKIKECMSNTNDKKLYDELKKQYNDLMNYISKMKECIPFTQLHISPPEYYYKDFNYFIAKHKKLRNIMKVITEVAYIE